ncbi:NADPH-dependent aldehyde reductase YqhD [Gammaproteobacteria bacterium]
MFNFTFHNPTKIIFGKDQISELVNEIPKNKRILLIYGHGSIKKNGVYAQVKLALKNHVFFEFGGIDHNPKYEQLLQSLPIIKQNKIDFLLAVGGGSVIDGTKFIAAAADFKGNPWKILENNPAPINTALPFGCVLTIPATGSEMNCGMVISKTNSPDKLASGHDLLYPQFSILDPTTTFSLPPKQTANGIVDTFVHVTEQYLTYPVNAAIQDRLAEGILLTLIEEAPKAFADLHNYDTRANLMWCSTCALNDFIGLGVPSDWATHLLGHEITARFGLDHGETLAILLPSLLNVKRKQKHEKILQYGKRVWNITHGSNDEKIDQAIQKTRDFFASTGIKTRLSDYNINASQIPLLIKQLQHHNMTALGEHKDIDLKQSELIYRGCV